MAFRAKNGENVWTACLWGKSSTTLNFFSQKQASVSYIFNILFYARTKKKATVETLLVVWNEIFLERAVAISRIFCVKSRSMWEKSS